MSSIPSACFHQCLTHLCSSESKNRLKVYAYLFRVTPPKKQSEDKITEFLKIRKKTSENPRWLDIIFKLIPSLIYVSVWWKTLEKYWKSPVFPPIWCVYSYKYVGWTVKKRYWKMLSSSIHQSFSIIFGSLIEEEVKSSWELRIFREVLLFWFFGVFNFEVMSRYLAYRRHSYMHFVFVLVSVLGVNLLYIYIW